MTRRLIAGTVALRPMRWADIERVCTMERELFVDTPWTPEQFWSEIAEVPATRWYAVAERRGLVVGYAGLMAVGRDADVQTVAVAQSDQGQGVARRLMTALVQEARSRGCTSLMLEVGVDNQRACHLYRALGFVDVSRRRDYYAPGADAMVMRLRLSDAS